MAKSKESANAAKAIPTFPIGQSRVALKDHEVIGSYQNLRVRAVTRYYDQTLGAEKIILSFDATTHKRLAMVIKEFADKMEAGDDSPVQTRNLSYNILSTFGESGDYTGKFIPVKGEFVKCMMGEVTSKAGNISTAVVSIAEIKAETPQRMSNDTLLAMLNPVEPVEEEA